MMGAEFPKTTWTRSGATIPGEDEHGEGRHRHQVRPRPFAEEGDEDGHEKSDDEGLLPVGGEELGHAGAV